MMFIGIIVVFSALLLPFYSKYRYELNPNENLVKLFRNIALNGLKKNEW